MEASALSPPAGLTRLSVAGPLLRLRSDEQLVALFRSGDDDAFQVIYDRYRQRIFAYTRQMLAGSRADAEDAMQDVFMRAYGALRNNERPVALKAWLYRVAHNRCIDQLRRPTPPPEEVFEMSRGPLRDPVVESERRAHLRQLVADMRDLPEQQRSALLMRELDGMSYNELATALDATIPAVKSLLVRARMGLVEAVEARESACTDIREELSLAHARGVRVTGRSRRHMRDCRDCGDYRKALRSLEKGLAALNPSGPFSAVMNLLGLGGSGAAAIGGGTSATVGGTAAVGAKVAAIVCAAAVVTGTATEVRDVTSTHRNPTRATVKQTLPKLAAPIKAAKPAQLKVSEAGAATSQADPEAAVTSADQTPDEARVTLAKSAGGMAAPASSDTAPDPTDTTDGATASDAQRDVAGSTP
jgi:RNA polymerase sigma factor (sigma-70 family)